MSKPESPRQRKLGESVREILAELLPTLKDPRIEFVTLTDVRTSTDLKRAQVFFTVLPDTAEARDGTLAGLRSATPLLRRELGQRLRVRFVPDLDFTLDPLPEQGRRIEALLREANETDDDR